MDIEQALDIRLEQVFPREILAYLKQQGLYEIIAEGKVKDSATLYQYLPSKFLRWSYGDATNLIDRLSDHMALGNVLEIACGRGNVLIQLAKNGYKPIFGVDISPGQLEAAKKRIKGFEEDVFLFEAKIEDFNFEALPLINNVIMNNFWGFLSPEQSANLLLKLKGCLAENGKIFIGPHIEMEVDSRIEEAYRILEEKLNFVVDYEPDYRFEEYGFKKEVLDLKECGVYYVLK